MTSKREWEHVKEIGGLIIDRDPETGSLLLIDRWAHECVYIQARNVLPLSMLLASEAVAVKTRGGVP